MGRTTCRKYPVAQWWATFLSPQAKEELEILLQATLTAQGTHDNQPHYFFSSWGLADRTGLLVGSMPGGALT